MLRTDRLWLLLVLLAFCVPRASAQAVWSEGAWYPDSTSNVPAVSEIPWTSLTHVDFVAPANPGSGGSISYPNGGPLVGDFSTNAAAILSATSGAHAHGVKVMFEITDDGNWQAALTGSCGSGNIQTLLSNIATVMSHSYGGQTFDGIFLDYEGGYTAGFGTFVACLRTAYPSPKLLEWFAGPTYQIGQFGSGGSATCGPGSNWNVSAATILAIANNLDRVSLSTYDIGAPGNGINAYSWFNSPLYSANYSSFGNTASVDWGVAVGTACGISASKLMIGVPFFGAVFTGNTAPYVILGGGASETDQYYNVMASTYNLNSYTYDSNAHVPWSAQGPGYINWENAQSVTDKVNYVYSAGLGGWMLWTMGQDYTSGSMPLLTAVGSAFRGGGGASSPSCTPTFGVVPQTPTCTNPNSGTTDMCYTTNGTTPATSGNGTTCATGTKYTTAITISVASTLKVIAGTSTLSDSSVVAYTYTAVGPPPSIRIQGVACESPASSTPCVLSGVASGDKLLAAWSIAYGGTPATPSISDNCGGTWVIVDTGNAGSTNTNLATAQAYSTGSHGSCTVTLTGTGTPGAATGVIEEISPATLDVHSIKLGQSVSGGGTLTTTSVTTTHKDYVFSFGVDAAGTGGFQAVTSPFTVEDHNDTFGISGADYTQSSSGAVTATWTIASTTAAAAAGTMAFYTTAAPPPSGLMIINIQ